MWAAQNVCTRHTHSLQSTYLKRNGIRYKGKVVGVERLCSTAGAGEGAGSKGNQGSPLPRRSPEWSVASMERLSSSLPKRQELPYSAC